MVVASPGKNRTLRQPPRSNFAYSNDGQQHNDLRVHLCQVQVQEDPEIFCQIEHISRLIAYAPPRLSWTPVLHGRNLYLLSPRLPKEFTGTNNQEGLTVFDTSTQYTFLY